ncbi:MAG: DnaJ domain-containing protein [Syntrophobacterales bacterium]|nr:DnaJ domain-containing protein [Syntrophobacterales bacterium]OPX36777.1 MAG: hypothetical protein B1H13_13905 [Desulfobacteraceae bacterium 4484_190.3]
MNLFKVLLTVFVLLYTVIPYDFIPDFIPVGGWLDDAFLMGVLIYYFRKGTLPDFFFRRGRSSRANQYHKMGSERADGFGKGETESKSTSDFDDPYEILGLKPGASREEIRAAYHRAAQAYHPDKVSHLGVEFQELAGKKFIKIQEAYEKLMGKSS